MSRGVGKLAASENSFVSRTFINWFARQYKISLDDYEGDSLAEYPSFNAFFTRALKPGVRPLPEDSGVIVAPADGAISQCGKVSNNNLLQAKGIEYSLESLLHSSQAADAYEGGSFATVYLSPSDYHRIHLPIAGQLTSTTAIPGQLYSVNADTEANVDHLFCVNERLVCHFETHGIPFSLVLVGALIVASIETVWPGPASPYHQIIATPHNDQTFIRGAEVGRFLLGSTAILVIPPELGEIDVELKTGAKVRMGEGIGYLKQ